MKELVEVRWHGRGGQGAKTAAQFLAEAALDAGKFIQAFPEYGPERAGAPMRAYTRISDNPINIHSSVTNPDAVVVIDPTLLTQEVLEGLPENGVLVVNTHESIADIRKKLGYTSGKVAVVDATKIALDTIKVPMTNTPMIGALLKVIPVVSVETIQEKIKKKFLKKIGEKKTESNLEAIKRAYNEVKVELRMATVKDIKEKTTRDSSAKREKGWKDIPIGGLIEKGGTAKAYKTGEWRTFCPVRDEAKCINCMICWAYCPDSAIKAKDGKMTGFDLDYCKGCGICASVCPVKCIKMEKENK